MTGSVVLFYRGSGIAGWLIRAWTRSKFAHCAPCIDGVIFEAFWGRPLARRQFDPSRDSNAVSVPLSGLNADSVTAFLESQVGKPYDKTALACDVLSVSLPGGISLYDHKQGCWDCSRLTATAFGIDALALHGPVTPEDVHRLLTAPSH